MRTRSKKATYAAGYAASVRYDQAVAVENAAVRAVRDAQTAVAEAKTKVSRDAANRNLCRAEALAKTARTARLAAAPARSSFVAEKVALASQYAMTGHRVGPSASEVDGFCAERIALQAADDKIRQAAEEASHYEANRAEAFAAAYAKAKAEAEAKAKSEAEASAAYRAMAAQRAEARAKAREAASKPKSRDAVHEDNRRRKVRSAFRED